MRACTARSAHVGAHCAPCDVHLRLLGRNHDTDGLGKSKVRLHGLQLLRHPANTGEQQLTKAAWARLRACIIAAKRSGVTGSCWRKYRYWKLISPCASGGDRFELADALPPARSTTYGRGDTPGGVQQAVCWHRDAVDRDVDDTVCVWAVKTSPDQQTCLQRLLCYGICVSAALQAPQGSHAPACHAV